MIKHVSRTVGILLALGIMLTGCSTNKSLGNHPSSGIVPIGSVAGLPSLSPDTLAERYLSANVRLTLSVGREKTSVKGKLRMKINEGVQVSIAMMGLMEAACIEFLPSGMRLIYKPSKSIAEIPYTDTEVMGFPGLGYKVLESMFLNRVFLPDGTPATFAPGKIALKSKGPYYILSTRETSGTEYHFYIDKRDGNLVRCEGVGRGNERVVCRYSAFGEVDGVAFPTEIQLLLDGDEQLTLELEYSRIGSKPFKFAPRRASAAYTRMSISEFIESLEE